MKKLGRYEILDILGRGSMGVVYKGLDPQIGKVVAIKTMNQKIMEQPELQERFFREGTILGQLQHKNIVNVYNVGVDGDYYFIAMEYLDGVSLESLLERNEKLSVGRILEIMKQVCSAVNAAHQQSVIHRDLKPGNIYLLENDLVKVLDFGVARFQNSQLTNSGMLLGTINYIAPEQITGLQIDYRADIFSVGVILYELLSGKNPFHGKIISQTMVKIVNENPAPIDNIPAKLQQVLDRALHKNRDNRYESALNMAADLSKIIQGYYQNEEAGQTALPSKTNVPSDSDLKHSLASTYVEAIQRHLKREEYEAGEKKLEELKRLNKNHPQIPILTKALRDNKALNKEIELFTDQLSYDTLDKANEKMGERHYIAAIELCQKVLNLEPNHQDAIKIKNTSIQNLELFLEKVKSESNL